MIRAKLIFAAATITAAATVANHWPRQRIAALYPPPPWHAPITADCGPGPRVLIVGASVALGWGVDRLDETWWVQLCRITGGNYTNLAVPATRVADHLEVLRGLDQRFDRIVAIAGANDLVLGLAPAVPHQVDRRLSAARRGFAELRGVGVATVLQPAPQGYDAEVRRAYAEMARSVDLDLSALPVDYVDRIHFGAAGQASLARAIAEAM